MNQDVFFDFANKVTRLKMYPYFPIAHYILMCLAVRDDVQPPHGAQFGRKHPLACWAACMVTCFGGGMLTNFFLGEAILSPLKDNEEILLASVIWYLIFYSPFDIFYKTVRFFPVAIIINILKEILRAKKVQKGVHMAEEVYPDSYMVIVFIGTCTGAGAYWMSNVHRLIRGVWKPTENNFLVPSFVTKACAIGAIAMVLQHSGVIRLPMSVVLLGVIMFFVYFRLMAILFSIKDPLAPIENLLCSLLLGGVWESLQRAMQRKNADPAKSDANGNKKTN